MDDTKKEKKRAKNQAETMLGKPKLSKGPLLWVALIFLPIIIAMVNTLRVSSNQPIARHVLTDEDVVTAQKTMKSVPEAAVVAGPSRLMRRKGGTKMLCAYEGWNGKLIDEQALEKLSQAGIEYRIMALRALKNEEIKPRRANFLLGPNKMILRVWCG